MDFHRFQQRHRKKKHWITCFVPHVKSFRESLKLIVLVVLLVCTLLFCIGMLHPTVAGDNLAATPWHKMSRPTLWSRITRVPHVLGCIDSCGTGSRERGGQKINFSPFNATTDPSYFKWIEEDLSPWRDIGISRHILQKSRKNAAFRVIIYKGKLYIELYYRCFQSRMMFTIWGLLELLEKYPDQVPNVEFYFNCQDMPRIDKERFHGRVPPPLFGYDSTNKHFDIPFPDWSFWGWPEIQIPPWEETLNANAQQTEWELKDPYAQWKGNLHVASIRNELLKCNNTQIGAYIYGQDWLAEGQNHFANSKLEEQCNYRYKIYIEGYSWSVSRKYIMSCGSVVLSIDSDYYDFFSRGLVSGKHHFLINPGSDMCRDIQRTIEWGNLHPNEAKVVATEVQQFVERDLKMDNIYRYMFKLLQEYAKLQKFKVEVPELTELICKDTVYCIARPLHMAMLNRNN